MTNQDGDEDVADTVAPATDVATKVQQGLRLGLTAPGPIFGPMGVVALLAAITLSRALGRKLMRRLRRADTPLLVCLTVPDQSWFDPLREAAKAMTRAPAVHVWDSTAKRTAGDPSVTEIVGQINKGRSVLCVSQDVTVAVHLALRTVADASVALTQPSAVDIALAISTVRGGRGPSRVPSDLGKGLSLHELAVCLRGSEAPRVMVDRIRRAMGTKGTTQVDVTAPRLEDLHGYGDAATWGRQVVADVGAFREGRLTWHEISAAAILYGPPGTGKSLFPRALARSLGAPILATSVSSWFQSGASDLGATIRAANAAFESARTAVRDSGVAVLFLDEIDSLPNREALDANAGSWWRPVVNHVLTSVDGAVSELTGVVLIAATNDMRALDPALLRPGRFGTSLQVLPPSVEDLAGVVRHHLGGSACPLSISDLVEVLRPFTGATQARAADWAADTSRRARDAGRPVRLDDLIGVVRSADVRPMATRRRIAVHEAGHAVAAWQLARDRFVAVSIVEASDTHGATTMVSRDGALLARAEIEDEVVIALCGRAADVVVGDGANAGAGGAGYAGASSDLSVATRLLTAVHATLGLGLTLRHREAVGDVGSRVPDDEIARLVEADLQRLMARAEEVIAARSAEVEAVARALLERSFLTKADVGAILTSA